MGKAADLPASSAARRAAARLPRPFVRWISDIQDRIDPSRVERREARRRERLRRKAVVEGLGDRVRRGPFAGMVIGSASTWNNASGYLLGSYEAELHAVIEEAISLRPATVVDLGAAEGYYAVGLARRLPGSVVHAVDPSERARVACAANAAANGVESRVRIHDLLGHEELMSLLANGGLLVSDCEGCELELLDPGAVPGLRSTFVVVELHEFIHPQVGTIIVDRFAPTHEVEMFTVRPRNPHDFPEVPAVDADWLLDERRPVEPHPMRWAVCRPSAAVGAGV